MPPCPICGRQPIVHKCEPWDSKDGPQPWHVGCYWPGENEHFVGTNADTKADCSRAWREEIERRKAKL